MSEFSELEDRIRSLTREPSADLRRRVMRAVDTELSARGALRERQLSSIRSWPALAALIALVVNLSFVAASQNEFSLRRSSGSQLNELDALRLVESQQEGLLK